MSDEKKAVLHILSSGDIGGIEMLCKSYAKYSQNNNIFLFPWNTGVITDEMEKEGYHVIRLNAEQKNIVKTFLRIRDICVKNNISRIVIHHNAPALLLYIPFLKKSVPDVIVYIYAHSAAENMFWISNRKKYLYYKPIVMWASKCADRIIAISEYVKSTVVTEMRVPEDKITVIYNGVDLDIFGSKNKKEIIENKENTNRDKQVKRIIFVGRLIEEKGVQVTLHGLALLPKDFEYTFIVVGDGPYKENLKRLAEKLGIYKKIVFLGERHDVPDLLAMSDIFIHMPVWEEGFGITIIEAMAAGLICVCANSGAVPEIITDGENGYIIPKKSAKGLADRLAEIKSYDQSIKSEIQHNAVRRAKDFSIELYVKMMDKMLNESID